MLSKISQLQKENATWYHLYEESKIVKLIRTRNGRVVARAGARSVRSRYLTGMKFQLYEMSKFLRSAGPAVNNIVLCT